LGVPASHTNFVLIRFADAQAAAGAEEALRNEGLLMRGMAGYGLADCLRATIGSDADMRRTGDILDDWVEGRKRT
jgi:histidinol-phosphate/aromatic aminotransferase/cobyric acid decarboxylase-like protein